MKWSLSVSKTAHAIDSSSSACGSITTLRTFLNENAKDTMNIFLKMMLTLSLTIPRKKVRQLVLKRMEQHLNVATNVFLQLNPSTNYQSDFSLSPRHWLNEKNNFANDILVFENEIFKNIFSPCYMIQKIFRNLKMISPQ